jgi:hypothetical protein
LKRFSRAATSPTIASNRGLRAGVLRRNTTAGGMLRCAIDFTKL